ncbi:MAG: hypothetical protein IJT72_04190 [Lachnospiraceae bacterium]|nr:hypothetical protein [Lachnospiraceae bacterium]
MDIARLKETIQRKKSLDINDDFSIEECWNTETEILSNNINDTINFIQTCSEDEFYELAEVFPEVIDKTQSHDLYIAMRKRNDSLDNQEYKASNMTDLKYAKEALSH